MTEISYMVYYWVILLQYGPKMSVNNSVYGLVQHNI